MPRCAEESGDSAGGENNKPAGEGRVFYMEILGSLSDYFSDSESLSDPGVQQDHRPQERAVQIESEQTPMEGARNAGETRVFGLLRQTVESAFGENRSPCRTIRDGDATLGL
jgi:hypothetical protein